MASPFTNYRIANNCTDGYAGWACVEEITTLIDQFEAESDLEKRKKIAEKIQVLAIDNVQFMIMGQYSRSSSHRADLEGLLDVGMPIFWNVKRKG